MTYDDLLNTVGGVPLILADLRARATAGAVVPPVDQSVFRIGSNFTPGAITVYRNLATGGYWQDSDFRNAGDASGRVDARGNLVNIPNGHDIYFRALQPPVVDGQECEVSWTEPGNATTTSRWAVRLTTYDDYVWADIGPVTFSDGKFRRRGKYRLNPNNLEGDSGGLRMQSLADGNAFADIVILPVGETIATGYRQQYLDDVVLPLRGALRHMETLQTNAWWVAYDWSARSLPTDGIYGGVGLASAPAANGVMRSFNKGISAETLIDLHNLSDRNVKFLVGYRWSDALITKWVQALFRGTDMLSGQKLKPSLMVSIASVGNEPWNPGFTGLYEELIKDGKAAGFTGSDNDIRVKQQIVRSNHVREVILAAVPEYASRLRFLWSGSPDNHEYEFFSVGSPVGINAVETSIYWGIYVCEQAFGNNTPAELDAPWRTNMDQQIASALKGKARYDAAGIGREVYEFGVDMKKTVYTVSQQEAWVRSPEYRATLVYGLRRIGKELGGDMSLYTDTGGSHRGWPFYQRPPLPSPKWDAVLQIQSEFAA